MIDPELYVYLEYLCNIGIVIVIALAFIFGAVIFGHLKR